MSAQYKHHAVQEELVHPNRIPLSEFVDHFDTFAGLNFPSHWHHELEIQLILSGSAEYDVNGITYLVEEGNAIYIAPETVHMMTGLVPNTVGYNILLLPSFLVDLLYSIHCAKFSLLLTAEQRPDALIISPERKEGRAVLEAMRKLYYMESSHPAYDLFLLESVISIWRNLFCLFPHPEQGLQEEGKLLRELRMKTMLSYIWEHYTQPITIQDIAASACISKSECFRCFSDLSKTSPIDYINQFRLLQAAQALCSSTQSISDICYANGFNNTSYFSKKFREQYGMTPKDYRSLHRGEG